MSENNLRWWTPEDEQRRIEARDAAGITAEDEARLLAEPDSLPDPHFQSGVSDKDCGRCDSAGDTRCPGCESGSKFRPFPDDDVSDKEALEAAFRMASFGRRRMWVHDKGRGSIGAFVVEPGQPSGVETPLLDTREAIGWLTPDERDDLCAFVVELVNAYASGDLVHRSEIERKDAALRQACARIRENAWQDGCDSACCPVYYIDGRSILPSGEHPQGCKDGHEHEFYGDANECGKKDEACIESMAQHFLAEADKERAAPKDSQPNEEVEG